MTTMFALDTDKQLVTAAISHLVRPGSEQKYEQWLHHVSGIAQQFPGYSGVSFIRPQDATYPEYTILLKFDCYQHLKEWLDAPIRERWIENVKPLVQHDQSMQVLSGLETWFTLPKKRTEYSPERYKMSILTALMVFVIAELLKILLTPILIGLPHLLQSLLLTVITVFCLMYLVMPRVTRLFYRWLYPKQI